MLAKQITGVLWPIDTTLHAASQRLSAPDDDLSLHRETSTKVRKHGPVTQPCHETPQNLKAVVRYVLDRLSMLPPSRTSAVAFTQSAYDLANVFSASSKPPTKDVAWTRNRHGTYEKPVAANPLDNFDFEAFIDGTWRQSFDEALLSLPVPCSVAGTELRPHQRLHVQVSSTDRSVNIRFSGVHGEGNDEQRHLASKASNEHEEDVNHRQAHRSRRDPSLQQRFDADFERLLENTPRKGEVRWSPEWGIMSEETRRRRAHGELVAGAWGVEVHDPCTNCSQSISIDAVGRCREYRHDLHSSIRQKLGEQCARCRLSGKSCSLVVKKEKPEPAKKSRAGVGGRPRLNAAEKEASHARRLQKRRENHARKKAAKGS